MTCRHAPAHARLDLRTARAAADALRSLPAGERRLVLVRAQCLGPGCWQRLARFVPVLGARCPSGSTCAWCAVGAASRPGESHGICPRHADVMRRVRVARRVEG